MLSALLVLTLALPATGAARRVDVDASVDVGTSSTAVSPVGVDAQYTGPHGNTQTVSGDGAFGVRLFVHPLRDDDAPPTLQAFLQRASDVHVGGGGGGGSTNFPNLNTSIGAAGNAVSFSSGYVDAGVEAQLGWLYLSLSMDVNYGRTSYLPSSFADGVTTSELFLSPAAEAGIRWRELLVFGGWSVQPYSVDSGAFAVTHWSRGRAGFRAVIRRFADLSASVTVLDGGASAGATLEVWIRRRLGLSLNGFGGHGAWYLDSAQLFDVAGGNVGVDCWLTPNEELSVGYGATWTHPDSGAMTSDGAYDYSAGDSISHVVSVTFRERR